MQIIDHTSIEKALNVDKACGMLKDGFRLFSQGEVLQAPSGSMVMPQGSFHIRYGMIRGAREFFVKHATGFNENQNHGLPPGDGFTAVYSSENGMLKYLLNDQGMLTDIRTALAVRICAEAFTPRPTDVA